MAPLALVLLALLPPARGTAAPVLRVSVPEGLACPSRDEILTSLSRRFGADRVAAGHPGGNELGLFVVKLPDVLEIDLVSKPGETPYRRRLPSGEGSCADLAETIGLLVDAWLRDLPWHGVGFLRDVPEVVQPGPSLEPSGGRSGETSRRASLTPTPSPPDLPPAGAQVTGPARRREALTLRLGGGASLGSDATNFGPQVTLSADATLFRGLGAAVLATALANASATDRLSNTATAHISASRQAFALAARYAFNAGDTNGPRVLAGLALQTVEAQPGGYTQDTPSFEPALAGFVAGLWQQRLWGDLSAYAQLSATLGPSIDFKVTQAGTQRTVLTLPGIWFDGSLGLALTFH